jgi:probable rRNA maturation factor
MIGGRAAKALPLCFDAHGFKLCNFQCEVFNFDGPTMVIFDPPISGAPTHSVSAAQLQRFARRAQKLTEVQGEVDILIASNKRLRDLNRRFRRKDKPTDVLSFPRLSGGDIAISAQIAFDNAKRYGHSLANELKILVLHGMLHLAGYDHESDNGHMARVESRLRSQLKLPASLIDRTHSRGKLRQAGPPAATSKSAKTLRKPSAAKRVSSSVHRSKQ